MFKKINTKSIQFKIILFTMLCTAVVGIFSNLYLYSYLNKIITQKAADIDTLYIETIEQQLDKKFIEIKNLVVSCASNPRIVDALMPWRDPYAMSTQKAALTAQSVMTDYVRAAGLERYVYRLMAFNESGTFFQSEGAVYSGSRGDYAAMLNSEIYKNQGAAPPLSVLIPSISEYGGKCLAMLVPVNDLVHYANKGYLYVEISPSMITEILEPYSSLNHIFAITQDNEIIAPKSPNLEEFITEIPVQALVKGSEFTFKGEKYRTDAKKLNNNEISLINCINLSSITLDNRKMTYTLLVVLASVLVVALGILLISSHYITRPLKKLVAHIRRMSENVFTEDKAIEASKDEIGEVGKVINEMCLSFKHLLNETAQVSDQKRNIEIALLQSQVNPHFLYNTLDSIHWMAVIQKSPGISNITRSLSNLLKNMAKGYSQKISLQEELKLLDDYVTIQSIRYMETFELINNINKEFYKYNIVKLTLQPLVENAIFHGIEPKGSYGTITLDAYDDEKYLYITVEDTGVGMTEDELASVLKTTKENRSSNSMNGIGVANVNNRLKLVYGKPCGIKIESEKNSYTRITICILKEEG